MNATDELERLRATAASALDDWYNHRDRPSPRQNRAAADLREFAHWLTVAAAEVEAQPQTSEEQPQ